MSDSKGPQGYDKKSHSTLTPPEPQEYCESYGEHRDLVGGEPTQDPTTLKANDSDHTPNHTRAPKQGKPEYGKSTGCGNGGVGL